MPLDILVTVPCGAVRIISDPMAPPGGIEIRPNEWVITPADWTALSIAFDRERLLAEVWD
jgi:hypothetical protein